MLTKDGTRDGSELRARRKRVRCTRGQWEDDGIDGVEARAHEGGCGERDTTGRVSGADEDVDDGRGEARAPRSIRGALGAAHNAAWREVHNTAHALSLCTARDEGRKACCDRCVRSDKCCCVPV